MLDSGGGSGHADQAREKKVSVDQYRREVERHQKEIARLTQDKAREEGKAAVERKRAHDASMAASRSSSMSTIQSKMRDAQRHEGNAVVAQKRVADLEGRIAREHTRLNDSARRLSSAQEQLDKRKAADLKREQAARNQQLSTVHGQLARHDMLHRSTAAALQRLQELPEHLTVLFLAANPIDQAALRLDEEARAIGEMIRKSEHRDAVRLESRWAVQPMDVLQAINECRPSVVHFSGHGSEDGEIIFQDSQGRAKSVSKEALVQTMLACSGEIQLVFFNTCFSRTQAEAVIAHVPCAIGMNTSIGDQAARIFSSQFYSAVGFGLSVRRSFQQAKAALMLEGITEDQTPELLTEEDIDADDIFLVKPPLL